MAQSGGSAANGGNVNITAGSGSSGSGNGGNIILTPGNGAGTGTGGSVAIGTTSPNSNFGLDIDEVNIEMRSTSSAGDGSPTLYMDGYGSGANWTAPSLLMERSRGTITSPTYALSGDYMGVISFRDQGASQGAGIVGVATENHSISAHGTGNSFFVVKNGTTTAAQAMILDQSGILGIGTTSPGNMLDIGGGGGIHMASGVPTSTTNALYNNGSTLMWNGSAVGGSSFSSDVSMTGAGTGLAVTNNETVGGTLGITGLTTLTGGATSAGQVNITNTTAAASYGSGALTVSGGAGIAGSIYSGGSISAASYIYVGNGSSALPSYSFTADTSTGAYLPVAGSYAISAGGCRANAHHWQWQRRYWDGNVTRTEIICCWNY